MWFNDLMDDLKKAFLISTKYRQVFIPIFLKLAMNIVVALVIIVGGLASVFSGTFASIYGTEPVNVAISIITSMSMFLLVGYILYMILYSFIEVGSINLYRVAISGRKPEKSDFLDVIKSYIGKVISGKLLIHFIALILSPIIIILYLMYLILIGTLTGGWGLVFLGVIIDMYFAMWTIAIVNDDLGVKSAISKSFSFAKEHFNVMFILILSTHMIAQYSISVLGPLGILLLSWFIGGVIRTYFKITTYITYLRYESSQYEGNF